REGLSIAGLKIHPNLVALFDAKEDDDRHFLVLEYVEGIDLASRLRWGEPMPVEQACDFTRQAAKGLQHLHNNNLVHRDIKPGNLMLTLEGGLKILDLGLVRDGGDSLTEDDALLGSLDYMAPEQAENPHDVDSRADLYSLGCTLYHLLTGVVPFPGGSRRNK